MFNSQPSQNFNSLGPQESHPTPHWQKKSLEGLEPQQENYQVPITDLRGFQRNERSEGVLYCFITFLLFF